MLSDVTPARGRTGARTAIRPRAPLPSVAVPARVVDGGGRVVAG